MSRLGSGQPTSPRVRVLVAPDDVILGPPAAPVTLVQFLDFQSVFDRRAADVLRELRAAFQDDLRVVVKHYPNTQIRTSAFLAAEAALAAHAQGKFLAYHDVLFANQDALDSAKQEAYAEQLDLDVDRFRRALDEHTFAPQVQRDIALARQTGVRTTPALFVNGIPVTGAVSMTGLRKLVERELADARRLMRERGLTVAELYTELMRSSRVPEPLPERRKQASIELPTPEPGTRYRVPVEGSPVRGEAGARLTLVAFSSYEDPGLTTLLAGLESRFGRELRLVHKHFPAPGHDAAWRAAEAAVEAHAQGRFWEFHQRVLGGGKLDRPALEQVAREVGLELPRFRQALDRSTHAEAVRADFKLAQALGLWDTPQLFVNGRHVRADAGLERAAALLEEELARARQLVPDASGDPYERLLEGAQPWVLRPNRPGPDRRPGPEPDTVYRVEVDADDPVLGSPLADATFLAFVDYTSPFMAKVDAVLREVVEANPQQRRLVIKQLPREEAPGAALAAEAALAAHAQGKFWALHERLLSGAKDQTRASLVAAASQAGLDVAAFEAALDSGKHRAALQEDLALAARFGLRAAPFVFLNGQAQTDAFLRKTLEQQVAAAVEAAGKRRETGVAPERLYAALIQSGLTEIKPPPSDERRYSVEVGAAPILGAPDAPLPVFIFSDFQCGFSRSTVVNIKRLAWAYPGKVKIVFKHFPLGGYAEAIQAAEASMAAHEQGQFWAMHDRIFAQQKLDRASLERYAGELGLDLDRFRAALDAHTYRDFVDEDLKLATSLELQGTPTFIIDGRKLQGAVSFEQLEAAVLEALDRGRGASASRRLSRGTGEP